MSYLKLISTLEGFFKENGMKNPFVPDVIPSYALLQELLGKAYSLLHKREGEQQQIPAERKDAKAYYEKTIAYIKADFCEPVSKLLEIFYKGDILASILFIEDYRRKHGLVPLFNSFPTQDRLTMAISHAFDMAKAEYSVYEQFRRECSERAKEHPVSAVAWTPEEREKARLMREHFEYTQNYAYRMIDVLEATYMS